jgi:hypothetical protein
VAEAGVAMAAMPPVACGRVLVQGRREAVCIELLLAGKSLYVTRHGATPDAAVDAAFWVVQRELHDVRAARQARTSVGVAQET